MSSPTIPMGQAAPDSPQERQRREEKVKALLGQAEDEAIGRGFARREVTEEQAGDLSLGRWLEPIGIPGVYAAVASIGGAPTNPAWYNNLVANPLVEVQDYAHRGDYIAREVTGDEKKKWWDIAVAAFPIYASYQAKTNRDIPVFVLEPSTLEA